MELQLLINSQNSAVVLLQETDMYPGVISPSFQGYTFNRRDRPSTCKGGGVAILIKNSIPHNIVQIPHLNNTAILAVRIPNQDSELV